MDAIQSNKTISETSEGSRWGGSGLYSLLVPYKNLLIALKRVFKKTEGCTGVYSMKWASDFGYGEIKN